MSGASNGASAEHRDSSEALPRRESYEASILGAAIRDGRILERLDDLAVEHLYNHRHKVVFQAMRNMSDAGKPIDLLVLEQEIAKAGKLEAIGGVAFLGELALTHYPTDDNIDCYRDEIIACACLREAALFGWEMQRTALSGALEPAEQLEELRASMARFLDDGRRPERADTGVRLLRDVAPDIVEQAGKPELDYGFPGLNRAAPLPIRSVCSLVAPTGGGKTSLAMEIAGRRSRYATAPSPAQGPSVHLLFELTPQQAGARHAAQLSRFTQRQILGGVMSRDELESALDGEHFYVVKPPRSGRFEIYDYAQRVLDDVAKRSPGIPLLVIDYLQRIRGGTGRDLRMDVASVVDSIVDLVESRDMYCLLLSKGSRNGSRSMRDGKTRGEALVDVAAETSAIEAGSAAVLAITYEDRDGTDTTDVRIHVAKGRFGATGSSLGMRFHGPSGRWEELDAPPATSGERAADDRVIAQLDAKPDGFDSANALAAAAKGNRRETLAAIRRMYVPGGTIELRDGRLCRRR